MVRTDVPRREFDFELPHGFVDQTGKVHRKGSMRLTTADDELGPLVEQRVRENPAYFGVVLLSLVVTRLGELPEVNANVIEQLHAPDMAYLQDFYHRINGAPAGQVGGSGT